jgi:L,D-peptidoglycan transpeptidase YkuD (ErfK/YbiS/YcfS/YnhG family)
MHGRRLALGGGLVALLAGAVPGAPAVPARAVGAPTAVVAAARPATASPTAAAPATVPGATAYAPPIPGVTRWLVPRGVRQVVVVRASTWTTTYGTVSLYSRSSTGWHRDATWPARLGRTGLVVGTLRVQDSGKTPAGSYRITQGFGRLANPGTRLPYTKVTLDHWWVEDRRSPYYNQMRLGSLGGFLRRTRGYNSSERLATMGAQYDYAAVVDFNRPHPVIGRGAGIFLHAFGSGATAGCVSVRSDHMAALLRWLDPASAPRIIIGTVGYLTP